MSVMLFITFANLGLLMKICCCFFLSNDHIWNYENLNSPISQPQLDIVFKFSGFSRHQLLSSDRRLKAEIAKVSKFAFSGVGLLQQFFGCPNVIFYGSIF